MPSLLSSSLSEFSNLFHDPKLADSCCCQLADCVDVEPSLINLFTTAGVVNFPYPSQDALQMLYEHAQPAGFGQGKESVLDPTYRSARTLVRDDFAINYHPSAAVLNRIKTLMLLNEDPKQAVRADLYRVNIYGPGDFFKVHKDTPQTGPGHFGSLVVCLPTHFEGGAFVVRDTNGEEVKYDWVAQQGTDGVHGRASIQYLAFATDLDHWVEPVTAGYRVTVTFHLFKETLPAESFSAFPIITHPITAALRDAVAREIELLAKIEAIKDAEQDDDDGENGMQYEEEVEYWDDDYSEEGVANTHRKPIAEVNRIVLFPLVHEYSNKVAADNELKGPDAALFLVLQEMGWIPVLKFYFLQSQCVGSQYTLADKIQAKVRNVAGETNMKSIMDDIGKRCYDNEIIFDLLRSAHATTTTLTVGPYYGNEPGIESYQGNLCIAATMNKP